MNLISIKLLLETVNRCEHFHILLLPSFVISEAVRTRCKRFQAITLLALSTLVCDDTEYHEVQASVLLRSLLRRSYEKIPKKD